MADPKSNGRRVGKLDDSTVVDETGVSSDYTPPPLEEQENGSSEVAASQSDSADTTAEDRQGISTLDGEEMEAAMLAASEGAVAELERSSGSEDSDASVEPAMEYDDGRDLLGGDDSNWSFNDAMDGSTEGANVPTDPEQMSEEFQMALRRIQELEYEGQQLRAALEHMKKSQAKMNEDLTNATEKLVQSLQDRLSYRQRVERERQELAQYANERLVTDLLPSLDSFELAIEHTGANSSDPFVSGIRMVRQQMLQALQRFNVEAFRSVGEAFDPTRHEAYSEVETTEQEPGTVVDVVKTGYLLSGRLLRPALVSVARAPQSADNTKESLDDDDELGETTDEHPQSEALLDANAAVDGETTAEEADGSEDAQDESE